MTLKRLASGRWQVRWRDRDGKQRAANYVSRELAQEKLRALHRGETDSRAPRSSKLVSEVVADWKRDRYPALSPTTRVRYDNLLRLYFGQLLSLSLPALTPRAIDEWVRWMKTDPDRFKKGGLRTSFHHELRLLRSILGYYEDYADDRDFVMPVKRRHFADCRIRNRRGGKPKDLGEDDFLVFRQRLEERFGVAIAAMATLQFYQALRISEAAALRWQDVHFDAEPPKSRLTFCQHVLYTRSKDVADEIEPGLKNSDEGKEHPMLPEVYGMLRRMHRRGAKGLVFVPPTGEREFFSYRQVQYRYDQTFKALGLPYSSTHVMRHGGARSAFDDTGGDVGIAAQQLGNADRKSVDTYAKRSVLAFTRYAKAKWESASTVHPTGEKGKTAGDNGGLG